jgi:hypothetical protein
MIAVSPSGFASVIQALTIKYTYFDILYTELWMSKSMAKIGLNTDEVKNDRALSAAFEDNGF